MEENEEGFGFVEEAKERGDLFGEPIAATRAKEGWVGLAKLAGDGDEFPSFGLEFRLEVRPLGPSVTEALTGALREEEEVEAFIEEGRTGGRGEAFLRLPLEGSRSLFEAAFDDL